MMKIMAKLLKDIQHLLSTGIPLFRCAYLVLLLQSLGMLMSRAVTIEMLLALVRGVVWVCRIVWCFKLMLVAIVRSPGKLASSTLFFGSALPDFPAR